jgi:hypothetical protein
MNDKPDNHLSVIEIALAVVVFALSMFMAYLGYSHYEAGEVARGIVDSGLSIACLGGCFEPRNALWLMLPFTINPLDKKSPHKIQIILWAIGFSIFLIGILYGILKH